MTSVTGHIILRSKVKVTKAENATIIVWAFCDLITLNFHLSISKLVHKLHRHGQP